MKTLTLGPFSHAQGEIQIPGSKSLSNRILLLAALAKGTTKITNLLYSDDICHMLNALEKLGITYQLADNNTTCTVEGLGGAIHTSEIQDLFLGNAGTAMRPLTAALCLGSGEYLLHGEPRMHERPIGDLVKTLQQLGAKIDYQGEENYPPLKITANGLQGGRASIKGNISSQFLTAILMSAPLAKTDLIIDVDGELVSKPYIDITLHVMKQFGIEVINDNYQSFTIKGQQSYTSPEHIMVEGDASSASYFLAAAAIAGGAIKVHGVGSESVQGDIKFADVLAKMGVKIEYGPTWIKAEKAQLNGVDLDMNHIPDAAMTIATTALFAKGPTTIRNIYNWRVKETDRLSAMATELKKLGAQVEEGEDFITVQPLDTVQHVAIDTYNDHRIAMCFSLVAFSSSQVTINDPDCTSKTFPTYFDLFSTIAS
ncbi:3-phosphoshikimate 1-carboxyvinyltransferase [Marinomonas agarivorans]|nr:3-phosphoshikimate 1-carboxyvinyltransferase [Marinomonas agarivorans]